MYVLHLFALLEKILSKKRFNAEIDECEVGIHDCPDDQFCVNDVGSYTCQLCQTGFETNVNETRNCLDIHESELGTHTCQNGE